MYVHRVSAEGIAVAGTGNTAETTITVSSGFTPVAGGIYDILITAQVPAATDGTILSITNGTDVASVYQRMTGNYARCRGLGWRKVIRVQYLDDPAHYNLLGVRG